MGLGGTVDPTPRATPPEAPGAPWRFREQFLGNLVFGLPVASRRPHWKEASEASLQASEVRKRISRGTFTFIREVRYSKK